MNQPNNQQQQGVTIDLAEVVQNLDTKLAEDKARWDNTGANPVLEIDVFDIGGNKQPVPVRHAFSIKQIDKISLDFDNRINAKKLERINIEEEIDHLIFQRDNVYGVLEAELRRLAKEKEEKLASAAKGK